MHGSIPRVPLVLVALHLASCQAGPPQVRHWGTVHEAMGQGRTGARVALRVVAAPGWWGVGALAKLSGEVTVVDGTVWTSRVEHGALQTTKNPGPRDQATLLFASKVRGWRRVAVARDVPAAELDAFIADHARRCGLDVDRPFAFRIEGPLRDLELHVIAGDCPVRAQMMGVEPTTPPFRATRPNVRGRLVGIYAADGEGRSSHHGHRVHVHVVIESLGTGHVDRVTIAKGATLFLPID